MHEKDGGMGKKGGRTNAFEHEGYGESGNILSPVPSIHPQEGRTLKVVLSSTKLRLKKTLEYSITKSTYNSLSPRPARFSLPIIFPPPESPMLSKHPSGSIKLSRQGNFPDNTPPPASLPPFPPKQESSHHQPSNRPKPPRTLNPHPRSPA